MSGDVNIVLLGLRAAHSAHDPFCAKILILDFVAEGPDPSALYVASCMADEIANDPSRFVHVYYMQNGVRKDLPLIPATDKHMFGTQPLGRNGSVIRIMESCGIMTSQCLDSRPYVVEITTVPPPPARLVDPAIEVAFDSKRIEQSPTIATVRPQSWHLIAP
jgi:hypothetical protein